jgi:hypothetical protein
MPAYKEPFLKLRKLPWQLEPMTRLPQWCVAADSKLPIDPNNYDHPEWWRGSTTRPYKWGTYEQCIGLLGKDSKDGTITSVGFVTTREDPFICVDIDYRKVKTDSILMYTVEKILADCGSYAELSPSGNGWHIYGVADKNDLDCLRDHGRQGLLGCIELYRSAFFFRVSGNALPTHDSLPLADLAALAKYAVAEHERLEHRVRALRATTTVTTTTANPQRTTTQIAHGAGAAEVGDTEVRITDARIEDRSVSDPYANPADVPESFDVAAFSEEVMQRVTKQRSWSTPSKQLGLSNRDVFLTPGAGLGQYSWRDLEMSMAATIARETYQLQNDPRLIRAGINPYEAQFAVFMEIMRHTVAYRGNNLHLTRLNPMGYLGVVVRRSGDSAFKPLSPRWHSREAYHKHLRGTFRKAYMTVSERLASMTFCHETKSYVPTALLDGVDENAD